MNEDNKTANSTQSDPVRPRRRHYYGSIYPGIWLVIIGVMFLLNNFGYFQGDAWGKLWPIFIIIPGLFMLFRPRRDY